MAYVLAKPGRAGNPPEIKWKLPPGITAGEIQWPVPESLSNPPFINYVYRTKSFFWSRSSCFHRPAGLHEHRSPR